MTISSSTSDSGPDRLDDAWESGGVSGNDKSIGQLIAARCGLSAQQIDQIVVYQRNENLRFGEAAVALQFASRDDVLHALSQQFQYDYSLRFPHGEGSDELIMANQPFSDEAEVFRDLRSQLMMSVFAANLPRRALAILSPNVGEGKTYMAANLAIAFSQLGRTTLLVDADMRTPRQHRLFDIDLAAGLSSVLLGRRDTEVIRHVEGLPHLYVMPVGAVPPNPMELLERPAFGLLIEELLTRFDQVIVDTPAAVHGADARVIAAKAGAALVIGRRHKTALADMQGLLTKLAATRATIAGVALNEY